MLVARAWCSVFHKGLVSFTATPEGVTQSAEDHIDIEAGFNL